MFVFLMYDYCPGALETVFRDSGFSWVSSYLFCI